MEHDNEPFHIRSDRGRIVLEGDLDRSEEVLELCQDTLRNAAIPGPSNLIVVAHNTRIGSGGVETWIRVVEQFLMNIALTYTPSQLSVILQYDETYQHPNSTFQDYSQYRTLQVAEDSPAEAWS